MQLSYLGKNFHGWQVQPNATSVQEKLNKTLAVILNDNAVYLVGAGRTDTGVHAREMWAHFDFEDDLPENLLYRWNSFIGRDIVIRKIVKVKEDAHARFAAVSREYEYFISTLEDPFEQDFSWFVGQPLDLGKMREAAEMLFNYEDFSAFSRSNTQTKTNICRIMKAEWEKRDSKLIFKIKADRFLRNMVRAIVGTLVEIGLGKRPVEEFASIIESKDRTQAGESAPAHGLFLTAVEYPETIFLNGGE